ncbi:16S rRNA (cytidine(1402)-2'-O)-methyltransferase [Alkalihalobacillus sp. LMS6]|uniref:16S rRNA (cytidine(1402)-2'-O)-methyltransferase n=1 Tax=Alkalihalobacillus sp. LMS6 TaxID=2924034 RepID=UPI0020D0A951|nr:16S rRNA (cytidine(1402)-2'-O)-methyltransferase [Alkalihalobacillus sp. LMS6]UTR06531.1 16S rRNA (cytidine(1402)-2'-O)-methyltransferase [Alkalihalobacillus sp. LMS6]
MIEQKSYPLTGGGLYLVPTPIGNLEDMTFRAINMLKEANLIAAEDTRQTKKLTNHFDIETPLVSYHEHNKQKVGQDLLEKMKAGTVIALVTDAGMPGISDPGEDLATLCIEEQIPVISLPGANAALTALVASGLSTASFTFVGFLPRGKKERKVELERLKTYPETLIFYEAPHRLSQTLTALQETLGNRKIVLARELTKRFEEFKRGTLEDATKWVKDASLKGEFCIVVEGFDGEVEDEQDTWWKALTDIQHVKHYVELGLTEKEAIKQTASDRKLVKRELYQQYHEAKK